MIYTMITLKLSEIAHILGGQLIGIDTEIIGAHNDTRAIEPGNLYIAVKGENLDGHNFVAEAQKAGAVAALVEHKVNVAIPQVVIKDATIAMGELAKFWREQFAIPVIGITGSVGKTTTRQMVGAILNQLGSTLISEGNKNNFYGVPLTLFRLSADHKFAVIEMGADRPDDIHYLTQIVQPQVATITMVAPVHIEVKHGVGFGSISGVLNEKTQIFSQLSKNGVAVLNADSPYIDFWHEKLTEFKYITFAMHNAAEVTASNLQPNDAMQYQFTLHTPLGETDIQLSALGQHNVSNAICASAVAIAVGAGLDDIKLGLANVPTVARRMIQKRGIHGALIIDDSYNANSVATMAVLDMLNDYKNKKRIMVFGDMRELGAMSNELHSAVGEHAKNLAIDYFFAYGLESKATITAIAKPTAKHFASHEHLVAELKPLLDENTVVVVKGSLGMNMNKVVEQITEE
jgi:UDP-N-acetylmuramoyl-tripeptide--D-alanyl-D-alanine ligase